MFIAYAITIYHTQSQGLSSKSNKQCTDGHQFLSIHMRLSARTVRSFSAIVNGTIFLS